LRNIQASAQSEPHARAEARGRSTSNGRTGAGAGAQLPGESRARVKYARPARTRRYRCGREIWRQARQRPRVRARPTEKSSELSAPRQATLGPRLQKRPGTREGGPICRPAGVASVRLPQRSVRWPVQRCWVVETNQIVGLTCQRIECPMPHLGAQATRAGYLGCFGRSVASSTRFQIERPWSLNADCAIILIMKIK